VLNAAPARDLPPEPWQASDVVVVNTSELEHLTGSSDPLGIAGIEGPGSVVVTVGAAGAYFSDDGTVYHCPAPPVDVVDTTGAGDAFCGALAHHLARGDTLGEATRFAVAAGSAATTGKGAQWMAPPEELERLIAATGPITAVRPAPHPPPDQGIGKRRAAPADLSRRVPEAKGAEKVTITTRSAQTHSRFFRCVGISDNDGRVVRHAPAILTRDGWGDWKGVLHYELVGYLGQEMVIWTPEGQSRCLVEETTRGQTLLVG